MSSLVSQWRHVPWRNRADGTPVGRRNPTVAAVRSSAVGHFGPKQTGRRYGPPVAIKPKPSQRPYGPKGSARLARQGVVFDETQGFRS